MEPVNLLGVFPVGPENFLCALLEWEGRGRVVPVWLPPVEGAQLAARLEEWSPRRPSVHDAMAEMIANATSGAVGINIISYHSGVFVAELLLEDGTSVDLRPSDALIMAAILDVPLQAEETVLQQASMYLSANDALDYFGIESAERSRSEEPGGPESGGARDQATEDFAEFMRELGVDEDSFGEFGEA